jgi:ribonuclease-3 family protein
MRFADYGRLRQRLHSLAQAGERCKDGSLPAPLALAYLGDAVFSLYVRTRLVELERNKMQVLSSVSAQVVSAVKQALALQAVLPLLADDELAIARRGKNAKSAVPKSATIAEYRQSTGLECLFGWLFWQGREERLAQLMEKSFTIIINTLSEEAKI